MLDFLPSGNKNLVAGVDGCQGGWMVVLRDRTALKTKAFVIADFKELLQMNEQPSVIAVDIPIGLLEHAVRGGRECDKEARRLLKDRACCVFNSPSRPALLSRRSGGDYYAVSKANAANSPHGIKLSKQSFSIMPKIIEVDLVITPVLQNRIFEIHPELSFFEANGAKPLSNGKKTKKGQKTRINILTNLEYNIQHLIHSLPKRDGFSDDDISDACIACWTAERIARDTATRIPDHPPLDPRGLRMEMWR